jgi:hypothetical protein
MLRSADVLYYLKLSPLHSFTRPNSASLTVEGRLKRVSRKYLPCRVVSGFTMLRHTDGDIPADKVENVRESRSRIGQWHLDIGMNMLNRASTT